MAGILGMPIDPVLANELSSELAKQQMLAGMQ